MKNIKIILYILILFGITACNFVSSGVDFLFEEKSVDIDKTKSAYLIRQYLKSGDDIPKDKVGEISYVENRSAKTEELFNLEDLPIPQRIEYAHDFSKNPLKENYARNAETQKPTPALQKKYVGDTAELYFSYENTYIKQEASCVEMGEHCRVWFINNTSLVSKSNLNFGTVAEIFDDFYEYQTKFFGTNIYTTKYSNVLDFDSKDYKVNIVIADIEEQATKNLKSGTFGYFGSGDFFDSQYSNYDEIIYIDSYFLQEFSKMSYSTLAHEFNHLLNYVQKCLINELKNPSQWYTEMLSAIAEDMFQGFLDISVTDSDSIYMGRIPHFLRLSNLGFTKWRNGDDVYASYGNVFAFGAYLMRNYGNFDLLKEIATNSYIDEESITKALQKLKKDETFDSVLKNFYKICLKNDPISIDNAFYYNEYVYFPKIDMTSFFTGTISITYGKEILVKDYLQKQFGLPATVLNYMWMYQHSQDRPVSLGSSGFSVQFFQAEGLFNSVTINENSEINYEIVVE